MSARNKPQAKRGRRILRELAKMRGMPAHGVNMGHWTVNESAAGVKYAKWHRGVITPLSFAISPRTFLPSKG